MLLIKIDMCTLPHTRGEVSMRCSHLMLLLLTIRISLCTVVCLVSIVWKVGQLNFKYANYSTYLTEYSSSKDWACHMHKYPWVRFVTSCKTNYINLLLSLAGRSHMPSQNWHPDHWIFLIIFVWYHQIHIWQMALFPSFCTLGGGELRL